MRIKGIKKTRYHERSWDAKKRAERVGGVEKEKMTVWGDWEKESVM